jgi:hypothetical protein
MAEIPWPKKAVPLTVGGFAKFYEAVSADPKVARAMADELEADGKRVFHHVFRLTKQQKPSIDNISDHDFRDRMAELIGELRSEAPRPMALKPVAPTPEVASGTKPRGPFIATITCKSLITVVVQQVTQTPTPTPTPTPKPSSS